MTIHELYQTALKESGCEIYVPSKIPEQVKRFFDEYEKIKSPSYAGTKVNTFMKHGCHGILLTAGGLSTLSFFHYTNVDEDASHVVDTYFDIDFAIEQQLGGKIVATHKSNSILWPHEAYILQNENTGKITYYGTWEQYCASNQVITKSFIKLSAVDPLEAFYGFILGIEVESGEALIANFKGKEYLENVKRLRNWYLNRNAPSPSEIDISADTAPCRPKET